MDIRMDELRVENVVATGDIGTQVNFSEILDSLDLPHVLYDPDIHQGLELRFIEEGPLITIYATGKYIIRASSVELLQQTREDTLNLLVEIGLLNNPRDENFEINNVVGSSSIGREIALDPLSRDLNAYETIYDPKTFPALRCKLEEDSPTVLLYRSGKTVITGAESVEEAEEISNEIRIRIDELLN